MKGSLVPLLALRGSDSALAGFFEHGSCHFLMDCLDICLREAFLELQRIIGYYSVDISKLGNTNPIQLFLLGIDMVILTPSINMKPFNFILIVWQHIKLKDQQNNNKRTYNSHTKIP